MDLSYSASFSIFIESQESSQNQETQGQAQLNNWMEAWTPLIESSNTTDWKLEHRWLKANTQLKWYVLLFLSTILISNLRN